MSSDAVASPIFSMSSCRMPSRTSPLATPGPRYSLPVMRTVRYRDDIHLKRGVTCSVRYTSSTTVSRHRNSCSTNAAMARWRLLSRVMGHRSSSRQPDHRFPAASTATRAR